MLSHDDRSRLEQIESMLRADDPVLDRALQRGRPRAPREYRRARWRSVACLALTAVVLVVSVATSRWPAVSSACLLAAIASSMSAVVVGTRGKRDRR